MKDDNAYYLTNSPNEEIPAIPDDKLKGSSEPSLPSSTVTSQPSKSEIPDSNNVLSSDEDADTNSMNVRLVAEEPEVPSAAFETKRTPEDEIPDVDEIIMPDRIPMPRLH